MFAIYLASIASLTDAECHDIMGEPKNILLARFVHGAQQALVNAKFLRSSDIVVLQALTLFLVRCSFLIYFESKESATFALLLLSAAEADEITKSWLCDPIMTLNHFGSSPV